jgi:hypothetical protein
LDNTARNHGSLQKRQQKHRGNLGQLGHSFLTQTTLKLRERGVFLNQCQEFHSQMDEKENYVNVASVLCEPKKIFSLIPKFLQCNVCHTK